MNNINHAFNWTGLSITPSTAMHCTSLVPRPHRLQGKGLAACLAWPALGVRVNTAVHKQTSDLISQ